MQNLTVVFHTVCAHVGGAPFFGGTPGPTPWDRGVTVPLETSSCPTCVTMPYYSVILGQTVRA